MTASPPSIPTGPVDAEPAGFYARDAQAAVLRETLTAAGVDLGAYDERIMNWLAGWDWSTVAVIIAWVARAASSREPSSAVALPGRFDATPAQVDQHLRRILADDTYLRYQQAIGALAVSEAVDEVRTTDLPMDYIDMFDNGAKWAADLTDPAKGGGPYPSQLLCSQHDGFTLCPGAPDCPPRDTIEDPR